MRDPAAELAEATRQFEVCNACRYCEGYCAVFPAMEERSMFLAGDLSYLAHLCHDCRACYQACPYTSPHELAIDIPALMARERVATYRRHARPRWLLGVFAGGPLRISLLTGALLVATLAAIAAGVSLSALGDARVGPGAFYALVPHVAMIVAALLATAFALGVMTLGVIAYWREICAPGAVAVGGGATWLTALRELASLRWMRGGGGECFFPEELRPSPLRRRLHALVMYGFMAAFLATVSAFVEESAFGVLPPYPLLSVPVVLGLLGGIGLLCGGAGLAWQKRADAGRGEPERGRALDDAFLLSLMAAAASGIALLCVREDSAMPTVLALHLATVAALYLTAPYGKFLHAAYRSAAILRNASERRASGN